MGLATWGWGGEEDEERGRTGMEGERVHEEAFRLPRGRLLLLLPARRGSCLSSPGVLGVPIGLDRLWLNFLPPFPPFVPCLCTMLLAWPPIRIQPKNFGFHKSHHFCGTSQLWQDRVSLHQALQNIFEADWNGARKAGQFQNATETVAWASKVPPNHRSFPPCQTITNIYRGLPHTGKLLHRSLNSLNSVACQSFLYVLKIRYFRYTS